MTLLSLAKQFAFAFELGRGAVAGIVELVRGKKKEPPVRGLSYQDVAHQQAQIKSATAHKVAPRPKD